MLGIVGIAPNLAPMCGMRILLTAALLTLPVSLWGQSAVELASEPGPSVTLPAYTLVAQRVANEEPVSTFAMPVTLLTYEPQVDLQTRNFAEAQGDITIRGGIFENTAIQIGGWSLFDPQTGHYLAEIPVSPRMLSGARILTGLDHASSGFNATVGTIRYGWAPIRSGGVIEAGFGSNNLYRGVIYGGIEDLIDRDGWKLGADFEVAHSRGDGGLEYGDHDFTRYVGRVQVKGERFETNVLASYQTKFFGWPNLYTPFGVAETDALETTLIGFSHRVETGSQGWVRFGATYRNNRDDYEFDRFRPGIFNPFEHETTVMAFDVEGQFVVQDWNLSWRGEFLTDRIESTSLVFGPFNSRSYVKGSLVGSRTWGSMANAETGLTVGLIGEDSNRDEAFLGPLLEIWRAGNLGGGRWQLGWQASRISQVPGYTAIGSNPNGGLFRGNPNLGREKSFQTGVDGEWRTADWSIKGSVFFRDDDPLVDWTYSEDTPTARTANPVAIQTVGAELVVVRQWKPVDLVFGYTWLKKDADYLGAVVDASFYALNYARHRFTAAVVWRINREFELRSDNELRFQKANSLRVIGGDEAVLSSLSLHYRPERWPGLHLALMVDNLWDSDFQELPAVPAAPRQWSGSVGWAW